MLKNLVFSMRFILIVSLLVIFLGVSCGLSSWFSSSPSQSEFEIVEEAWQVILHDFVDIDDFDLNKLSEAAVRGMVAALDDPYSAYFNADEYDLSKQRLEGSYAGIGAEITVDEEGQLMIVAPIVGTPAQKAGILAGDRILEINDETTEGLSTVEAVLKIRGEPGTEVTLRVLHIGDDVPRDIVIVRERIQLDSIFAKILPDNIAHIKVNYFSRRTGEEIINALKDITSNDSIGIILDLRDNPGGLLDAAVILASQFLEEGIVTYVEYKDGERDNWEVQEGGLAMQIPLAVLINGNSASASEVVAGALQDYERGIVIGTNSLGKGSVNHLRELSDESAIYITIARWFTPNGRQIEGQGISPDETVEITAEDIQQGNDPQFKRAIDYIKNL